MARKIKDDGQKFARLNRTFAPERYAEARLHRDDEVEVVRVAPKRVEVINGKRYYVL